MKKMLTFLFLLSCTYASAQINIGTFKKNEKSDKEQFQKFKKTTTIFVLSDVYEKEQYEEILKETWNLTPYVLINHEDFNMLDYMEEGKYSFVTLSGERTQYNHPEKGPQIHVYYKLYFFLFDLAKIKEDFSDDLKDKKINQISSDYRDGVANIRLFAERSYFFEAVEHTKEDLEKTFDKMFTEDVFHNYQIGILKNYFQAVNQLLKDEARRFYLSEFTTTELKSLKIETLYIPEYVKYINGNKKNSRSDKAVNNLLATYKFEAELIDEKTLSQKILNGEKIYYLRFSWFSGVRYIEIVNGETGEVIHQDKKFFQSKHLSSKQLKALNKAVKTAK